MNLKRLILPLRSSLYSRALANRTRIDFAVIGFPKCATTSIHKTLEKISDLYLPDHEVQIADIMSDKIYLPKSNKAVGIKNPNLIYEPHNILALYKSNKNMKFIISMRNPSDWLFSFYQYRMLEIKNEREWLTDILKRHSEYRKISFDDVVYNGKSFLGVSVEHGFFVNYLEDLYKWIPKENILIVMLEEIATNPSEAYSRIFEFVDIGGVLNHTNGVVANDQKKFYQRREDYKHSLSYLDKIYKDKNIQLNQFLMTRADYDNIYWS